MMEEKDKSTDAIIIFAEAVQKSNLNESQKNLLIREYIRNDKKNEVTIATPINDSKKTYFWGSIILMCLCLILLVIVFDWALKVKIFTDWLLNISFFSLLLGLVAIIVIAMIFIKNKIYDSSTAISNKF